MRRSSDKKFEFLIYSINLWQWKIEENKLNKLHLIAHPLSLENQNAYFVHSYYIPVNSYTSARTDYVNPFSAAMRKDNFYAVQFHPEKSAEVGEKVLKSFFLL